MSDKMHGYGLVMVNAYKYYSNSDNYEESLNFRGRSKIFNQKIFGIYEKIEDGTIQLVYCGTEDMITKVLVGKQRLNFTIARRQSLQPFVFHCGIGLSSHPCSPG